MSKRSKFVPLDQPLFHADHARPKTRRDFLAQGFTTGTGLALCSPMALLSQQVNAALTISSELPSGCRTGAAGNDKIPFICFDLAGGANIAGSNVLVGKQGGQLDILDTAGYNKQGLPGDQIPVISNDPAVPNQFVDESFGLAFHSDSQMLAGMTERAGTAAAFDASTFTNGAVIPARSQNDTGNNPHNPMYGIARAGNVEVSAGVPSGLGGANGEVIALIGSRNADSGGNSMAPASMIDLAFRPTKVDRPADARGLVDLGGLLNLPGSEAERTAILEAAFRLSDDKLDQLSTGLSGNTGIGNISDAELRDALRCSFAQSADLADRFGAGSDALDPLSDPIINGQIFTGGELSGDREFAKTASVMKLVIDGLAGAGTITMGGYDYHTGDRRTGEGRDLRAGRCIGACLAYAAAMNKPVMIYVVSDGSVFSNGMLDNSAEGRGKGVWTGDSQQTASAFFLVYDPRRRPVINTAGSVTDPAMHQQLGWMTGAGNVQTTSSPAANNVEALVNMVVLNYMALHGETGLFSTKFPNHGLGSNSDLDRWTAFEPLYTGVMGNPV
ncbi:MAG: hypothetical protein ACRBCS_04695 [Cellvibrionaceae bacterium]